MTGKQFVHVLEQSSKGASTFSTATLRITELSITIKIGNSHKLAQQSNTQNNITQHNNKNVEFTLAKCNVMMNVVYAECRNYAQYADSFFSSVVMLGVV